MRIGALEACPQIIKIAPAASRTLLWSLQLRTSGALGRCSEHRSQPRPWTRPDKRSFASFDRTYVKHVVSSKIQGIPSQIKEDKTSDFGQAQKKGEPEAWIAVLDQYLPPHLRLEPQKIGDGLEDTDPATIEEVPSLLDRARQAAKVDLLCFIGVYQERWKAVHWLVTTMLAKCPPHVELKRLSEQIPTILWDTNDICLDEIARQQIEAQQRESAKTTLGVLVGNNAIGTQRPAIAVPHQMLGALWQSLGSMLLEIEDRSIGNPNRPLILSHVLWILADMHHRAFIPDTMYNYDLTENKSILQRPPMLYLHSEKILADLSDISWSTHWAQDMEKAESDDVISLPRILPQMPRMGPEVWLELVLWVCVQGGWISDAAWIVGEIERRGEHPDRRWSVISWDEISSRKVQELGWINALKGAIDKSRSNQATEIAVANRRTSNVQSDMGTRTISREVVLAIADGLANLVTDNDPVGNIVAKVQNCLLDCQSLLARGQLAMDSGHMNTLILRAMETSGIDARLQPDYLKRLLTLRPAETQSSTPSSSLSPLISTSMLDVSAPILGLLHRLLGCYARQRNLRGSLQSLILIQEAVDGNRDIYIQDFADELKRRGRRLPAILKGQSQQTPLMLFPEIPPYVVEAFLDLLVESKAFRLGQWVLSNDDIDGGILSPNLLTDVSLQPALLRFATATADEELLLKVLEHLEMPLSESTLHALLRCQVAINRWDGVEGILKRLRDTHDMAWTPVDAMTIAAAILTLESKDNTKNTDHTLHPKGILQALVQGQFNSPQNYANIPDLREIRTANQLGRICQSVTGAMSTIELGHEGRFGRASYIVKIPSDAFNIFLTSVVQNHGLLAGVKLWERWCLDPKTMGSLGRGEGLHTDDDGREKVVRPTVSMLRSILQPTTERMKSSVDSSIAGYRSEKSYKPATDQRDQLVEHVIAGKSLRELLKVSQESLSVFDWCIGMYRKFGISEQEILREIPPYFGRIIEK